MRTVYLGTAEFAAVLLRRLAASPHRPVLVVTRPDRPRGRGRRLASPPVAAVALELGIELAQPESVNDEPALATIAAAGPDVVCVCAFGALIKEPLLSRYSMLNVHPSLLPRWRGAAPIERAIMNGDEHSGISIMQVGEGFDDGPVCARASEPITPEDTYGSLAARLEVLGADLLVRTLDESPPCVPQDEALATYAAKIGSADRELDPSRPAAQLERTVRALTPHIGAYLSLDDGQRLGVSAARVLSDGPPAGEVSFDGIRPVLGCGEGALELLAVKPPGRRAMSGEEYLRGRRR
ncbi:MAG: methionyl-tRNA formyltransferase [Solirubrobacterales bacterium]|nr:methionyl-tRNA formyltransferase [Solirubrobacterales bacterium]